MKKRFVFISMLLALSVVFSGCESATKVFKKELTEEEILEWKVSAANATVKEFSDAFEDDDFCEQYANGNFDYLADIEAEFDAIYYVDITDEMCAAFFDPKCDFDNLNDYGKNHMRSLANIYMLGDVDASWLSMSPYRSFHSLNYFSCDFEVGTQALFYETNIEGIGLCAYINEMNDGFASVMVSGFKYNTDSLKDLFKGEEFPYEYVVIKDVEDCLEIASIDRTKVSSKDFKAWRNEIAKEVADDLYTLMNDEEFCEFISLGKEKRHDVFDGFAKTEMDEKSSYNIEYSLEKMEEYYSSYVTLKEENITDWPKQGQLDMSQIMESLPSNSSSDLFAEHNIVRRIYECDYDFENQYMIFDTDTEGYAVVVFFMPLDNGLTYVSAVPLFYDEENTTLEQSVSKFKNSNDL